MVVVVVVVVGGERMGDVGYVEVHQLGENLVYL